MESPTYREIVEVLNALIAGRISRDDASAWAHPWVIADDRVRDDVIWDAVVSIGAVDTPDPSRPSGFLYNDVDFAAWLSEVEAAMNRRSGIA